MIVIYEDKKNETKSVIIQTSNYSLFIILQLAF